MTTATLTKTQTLTLTYGNAWFDVKGLTKEEFAKNLTPEFFENERKFLEDNQRLNSHDWEHTAGCEDSLFRLQLAKLAFANGDLKVKTLKLVWDEQVDEDITSTSSNFSSTSQPSEVHFSG